MPPAYEKPFKTVAEQIDLLRSRGMVISNPDAATLCLESVGYYRLSGYWYPDRRRVPVPTTDPKQLPTFKALSEFRTGATFEHANHLYEIDRKLKLLVMDGLERVEVAMRFQLGHVLGEGHPYAHCDLSSLSSGFTGVTDTNDPLDRAAWLSSEHAKWLLKVRRQEDDSKEEFVKHFKRKYGSGLPVWVTTEILDFGGMSTLYAGLKQAHRDQIAESLGFEKGGKGDGATLAAWMKNLNYIRNTCAHHARLWNKNMAVQGSDVTGIPDLSHAGGSKDRVYASMAVIAFLLLHINPETTWRNEVTEFIQKNSGLTNPSKMGFPPGWEKERLWDPCYRPQIPPEIAARRKIRNKFECLGAAEVGATIAPLAARRDATSTVRRLRSENVLLALQLESNAPARFPTFQFEEEAGCIKPIVAYANRKLIGKIGPWAVAEWWITANDLLAGRSPLQKVEESLLTEESVDTLVEIFTA